jgi:hypothetical protein
MSDFNVSGADPPDVFTIVDLSPDRALFLYREAIQSYPDEDFRSIEVA